MRTLIFSIALNGYQWRYRSLIDSHQRYADKHGYDYTCITRPVLSTLGLEVAWLKIKLIIAALESGYSTVCFLDADTEVRPACPPLEAAMNPVDEIYAAKGFSGRVNSGVMIVKKSPDTLSFFKKILLLSTRPVPQVDSVGWGENGHVTHYARQFKRFATLDMRWNNNHDPDLTDYIRHYSRGPLHHLYQPGLADRVATAITHYALAFIKRASGICEQRLLPVHFYSKLEALTQLVKKQHREFRTV